jgi:hypothetical protein
MKTHKQQYSGLAGKVVKYADSFEEGGQVNIGIRFTDNTELSFVVASQATISRAALLKWEGGNSSVVRAYKPRALVACSSK